MIGRVFVTYLVVWLFGRLVGCFVVWSVGWLVGWLGRETKGPVEKKCQDGLYQVLSVDQRTFRRCSTAVAVSPLTG